MAIKLNLGMCTHAMLSAEMSQHLQNVPSPSVWMSNAIIAMKVIQIALIGDSLMDQNGTIVLVRNTIASGLRKILIDVNFMETSTRITIRLLTKHVVDAMVV